MADAHRPSPMPADWGDAFGALPLAQAPDHAWRRVADALPVQVHAPSSTRVPSLRRGQRTALAIAASVVVALPVAWWLARPAQPAGEDVASAVAAKARPSVAASAPAAPPRPATDGQGATPVTVPRTRAPIAAAGAPAVSRTGQATAKALRHAAAATADAGSARRLAPQHAHTHAAPTLAAATPSAAEADPASVVRLQQESARLEALVALARDDRMASAPAAVMSAALDDRIRLIDAALTQRGLDVATRASLWSERVDTLQDLASLEGTRRWMAAHGDSMDAVARVD